MNFPSIFCLRDCLKRNDPYPPALSPPAGKGSRDTRVWKSLLASGEGFRVGFIGLLRQSLTQVWKREHDLPHHLQFFEPVLGTNLGLPMYVVGNVMMQHFKGIAK